MFVRSRKKNRKVVDKRDVWMYNKVAIRIRIAKTKKGDTFMKKLLSVILLVAMLSVVMVSCNKPEDPTTPAGAETRTTITAEEWAATIALENYTFVQQGTSVYTMDGQTETENTTRTCMRTATAYYHKSLETGDPDYEVYEVIEDGVCYVVDITDGVVEDVWVAEDGRLYNLSEEMDFDGATFEDLVYNAETKAYDYTVNEDGMDIKYSFYFENGVLVRIVASATMVEGANFAVMSIDVTISNLGTTVINVPAFEKPSQGE